MRIRLSLIFPALISAGSLRAQEVSLKAQTPHLTVSGSAHAEVVPDLAVLSFSIVTERPTPTAASGDNAQAAQAVVAEIKSGGVEAKDIRTVSVTLSPVYDESRDLNGRLIKRTLRGYSARNALEVRMRAIDKAGNLARQLVEKGANNFGGIAFMIEHPEPKLKALQSEAAKDALSNAESYTNALGLKLGRVIEIVPGSNGNYPAPVMAKFAAARAAPEPAPAADLPLEPGIETLSSTVTVTWELAD